MLVGSAATAICGRLGDIDGRRRMVLLMLAACAAGSLISAFSSTLEGVIVGRSLQGFAAPILPLCYGLGREHLPSVKVPFATGVIGGTAAAGVGAGVLPGGVIIGNGHMLMMEDNSASLAQRAMDWLNQVVPTR